MRNPSGDIFDVIVEPRYDTQTIPAAGSLQLNYFAVPVGQGQSNFGAAGVVKQYADTNLDLAAQLPAGFNFSILGFRVQPAYTMTQADANKWSVGAWFTFTIGQKPFLRTALDTIPAGNGPIGSFATAAAATNASYANGWPALANAFTIARKPLLLPQTANFGATINWVALSPVTGVVPTQTVAGLPVRVYMDGILTRVTQ